ncbi:MOSC N-terminal beta barrel domain-containing protein [Vannielia sp.]|uniref:MOSC domain-containing protein n=1 Tax=Vannielia sp. TaxID=2813045 RepID=UPI00263760B6|nr:MOSC N-terminal beta barrel domain-containing protein [Vannielia sp.]MDF1871848.1 MOSC domain-containing protein [Vannielia sp.]
MTGCLAEIWRHPIKSHGRERVEQVALKASQAMPGDRVWAVAHADSDADGSEWASCSNFSRTSRTPALAPFWARLQSGGEVNLRHTQLGEQSFNLDDPADQERFVAWVAPLTPESQPAPNRVVKLEGRGFTDSDFPSVTLCNCASHRAVEEQLGQEISPLRWRGNLWVDGFAPWAEWDWLGREIRIGEAVLVPRERTDRCPTTMANPETGERDVPTVKALLDGWGHKDFSVRCVIVQGGAIREGDEVSLQ